MKRRIRSFGIVAACFAAAACFDAGNSDASSAEGAETKHNFPALTGRVVDEADLLRPDQESGLVSKSEALEAATGRQFVVVTVTNLKGEDVAAYTRDLGNKWGIGHKDRDDGVILLVAPTERKARIAVGRGLENTLTDKTAEKIMQSIIIPKFRSGDLSGGIEAGADALIAELSRPPTEQGASS